MRVRPHNNQVIQGSFEDERKHKNSTILTVKGVGAGEELVPVKGVDKPAAMTSLNFYSTARTTART